MLAATGKGVASCILSHAWHQDSMCSAPHLFTRCPHLQTLHLQGPGMYAGIGPDGRLFEFGSATAPSLAVPVWEAQGRAYLQQVEAAVAARLAGAGWGSWGESCHLFSARHAFFCCVAQALCLGPAPPAQAASTYHPSLAAPGSLAVPVVPGALMPQGEGARAAVQLPPARQLAGLDRLELHLQLGCPGADDASCPDVRGRRLAGLREEAAPAHARCSLWCLRPAPSLPTPLSVLLAPSPHCTVGPCCAAVCLL